MTALGVAHFDLTNRLAVVLGAENPAGTAIARAYAEAGAVIALCVAERNPHIDVVLAEMASLGRRCEVLIADLSAPARVSEAIRSAAAMLGGMDVLAVCSDVFFAKPIAETSDEELEIVMAMNFGVPFAAARAAVGEMRERAHGGRLLLLTHVLGERGLSNTAAYGAAHAATQNLVRTLGRELGPEGITVNSIALGWMDWMSDRLDPHDEEAARAIRFAIIKRAGQADDIGPLAVWLSGDGAGYVTGQIFHLDGGLTQHL